jgi:hypothetical protein
VGRGSGERDLPRPIDVQDGDCFVLEENRAVCVSTEEGEVYGCRLKESPLAR